MKSRIFLLSFFFFRSNQFYHCKIFLFFLLLQIWIINFYWKLLLKKNSKISLFPFFFFLLDQFLSLFSFVVKFRATNFEKKKLFFFVWNILKIIFPSCFSLSLSLSLSLFLQNQKSLLFFILIIWTTNFWKPLKNFGKFFSFPFPFFFF